MFIATTLHITINKLLSAEELILRLNRRLFNFHYHLSRAKITQMTLVRTFSHRVSSALSASLLKCHTQITQKTKVLHWPPHIKPAPLLIKIHDKSLENEEQFPNLRSHSSAWTMLMMTLVKIASFQWAGVAFSYLMSDNVQRPRPQTIAKLTISSLKQTMHTRRPWLNTSVEQATLSINMILDCEANILFKTKMEKAGNIQYVRQHLKKMAQEFLFQVRYFIRILPQQVIFRMLQRSSENLWKVHHQHKSTQDPCQKLLKLGEIYLSTETASMKLHRNQTETMKQYWVV